MRFNVKIVESEKYIAQQIMQAIASHLQQGVDKAKPRIITGLQDLLRKAIMDQPEYNALLNGDLRRELGIPQAHSAVASIVDAWVNNFSVSSTPIVAQNNYIKGGFSISMVRSDYEDVLGLPESTIIDQNTGSVVPWLSWLLLAGGDILVRNYEVKFVQPTPRSRTQTAVMVSSKKNWRMPAEYAGTTKNNWVYRAISTLENKIPSMIKTELEKSL